MDARYTADADMMFLAADGSMMCEAHPGHEWPHDDCVGPGTPWVLSGRTLIEEVLTAERQARAALEQALVKAHSCATLRDDGTCDGCFVSEALLLFPRSGGE